MVAKMLSVTKKGCNLMTLYWLMLYPMSLFIGDNEDRCISAMLPGTGVGCEELRINCPRRHCYSRFHGLHERSGKGHFLTVCTASVSYQENEWSCHSICLFICSCLSSMWANYKCSVELGGWLTSMCCIAYAELLLPEFFV